MLCYRGGTLQSTNEEMYFAAEVLMSILSWDCSMVVTTHRSLEEHEVGVQPSSTGRSCKRIPGDLV